ncbi:septum formation initiator family protein [Streptomyces sp. NPDC050264]|uniref:septum formation initiator family protein n=1 Tax=Streptomyces sp. NPDC050264 TaxID=3155038 RepID=UPI003430BB40
MTARSGSKDTRDSKGPKGSKKSTRGSAREPRGRAARLARLLPVAPSGGAQAARAPFVLLVVLLLGGGLITLLMLNSSLNEGSFKLSRLKKQTTELTDDEQQLQRDVDSYSAPDALQRRARELGMVAGGDPAFLSPNGTVRGMPSPAALPAPTGQQAPPPPEMIGASPSTPAASPTAAPSTTPTASPTASPPEQPASAASATPTDPAPSNSGR